MMSLTPIVAAHSTASGCGYGAISPASSPAQCSSPDVPSACNTRRFRALPGLPRLAP